MVLFYCPQLNLLNPPNKIPGYATGGSMGHIWGRRERYTWFWWRNLKTPSGTYRRSRI